MSFEICSENPVVRAVLEGQAPRPARLAAARGMLPLPEPDLLEVLVGLCSLDDAELAEHAGASLKAIDPAVLIQTIQMPETAVSVLRRLGTDRGFSAEVHEAVIANSKTPADTLLEIAKNTQSTDILERLAFNQQLLIETPMLIDAILSNPIGASEAHRRASETKREFFEKERGLQQIAGELRAQGKDAAAEFIEQAEFAVGSAESELSFDDAMFIASMIESPDRETDDSWLGLEYLEELYEETEADRGRIVDKILGEFKLEDGDLTKERVSTINRILKMGMKDRVKLAMKGDREARNILIRDPNRIVAAAVVSNPRITEQEVEKIASMRTVTEEILRGLASNRQWSRNYRVIHHLAKNPRTPIANVLNILTRLQMHDLVSLSKDRNVSDAVRRQALRLVQSRAGH